MKEDERREGMERKRGKGELESEGKRAEMELFKRDYPSRLRCSLYIFLYYFHDNM